MAYDFSANARHRAAVDAATDVAKTRDDAVGLFLLQVSKQRYAIVERSGMSWSHLSGSEETDPKGWSCTFTLKFVEDESGKPLKNLKWREAEERYRELMLAANVAKET